MIKHLTHIKIGMTCLLFSSLSLSAQTDEKPLLSDHLDQKIYQAPVMHTAAEHDKGDIKAIFYETLPHKGKETRAFAYLGIPKSDKPVPAMVLVHGGGGKAFHEWVKIWNSRGYAAIAMSLEGHAPNAEGVHRPHELRGLSRNGRFDDANLPLEEQWMTHAVSNIISAHSLLRSLPEIDADRIGITGISWGGILSSLVSGVDSRFKCAIPVYGAGFLYESHGRFKSVTTEEQKFWDPARYFTTGSMPTLWVNGDNDGHFSVNITSRSFEATKDHAWITIHPGLPHGHKVGRDPKKVPEIYAFADHILKGKMPEPGKITKQPSGREMELAYESKTLVKEATVYYLNEPLTYYETKEKHDRPAKWLTMPAEVDSTEKTVKASLPDSCLTYYVNLKDSAGHVTSSVLVELAE